VRTVSWVLGILLGVIAGGAALVAGVLALLLITAAVVWAAFERMRPLALGGFLVGLGAGIAGLLAFANARCESSNVSGPSYSSACVSPDLTAFFVAAAVVAAIGAGVSVLALIRGGAGAT